MRIPTWRLVLTGGAITILAVAGIGLVAAAGETAVHPGTVALAAPTAGPNASPGARDGTGKAGIRAGLRGARLLALGRHLVHAQVTVTNRDGALVQLQLDHGTVQAIGGGSLTIAEAGGAIVTVSTDDATIVRAKRAKGALADVSVGDEVFVQSRIDGATTLAKRILVVPAAAS